MHAFEGGDDRSRSSSGRRPVTMGVIALAFGAVSIVGLYELCKVEVGTGQQAVLIRLAGLDLERQMELAPPRKDGRWYKGVQTGGSLRRGPDRGAVFLQPDLLVVGRSPRSSSCPMTRSVSGLRFMARSYRPARCSPSRARRGSFARSSSRAAILTTATPRTSSSTTRSRSRRGSAGSSPCWRVKNPGSPTCSWSSPASAGSRPGRSTPGPIT